MVLEVSRKRVIIVLIEFVLQGGAAFLSGIYFQEKRNGETVNVDFTVGIGAELQAIVVESVPEWVIRMNPRGQLADGRVTALTKKL